MKKTLAWCVVAGFLMILLLFYWPYLIPSERKALRLLKLCKTLEYGMSSSQVIQIMGEPVQKRPSSVNQEIIFYAYPTSRVSSEPTSIGFKQNQVVGISCGG